MAPFTVKWGILATGWIAEQFVNDIQIDPATRGVSDVAHVVVAAASSSSADKAQKFLEAQKCPSSAKAYGNYQELAADSNVDAIYVATPHSHHYQNVMLCLENNKHVLCEKSFTVNAQQTIKLTELAKNKGLFLMEAVWTRHFPLSIQIREKIANGDIGPVHRTFADLSMAMPVEEKFGTTHRMTNMDLAGGALLDLGVYSLTWVFQTLYHTIPVGERKPPTSVKGLMSAYPQTGADEMTSIIMTFPKGPAGSPYAHGIATTTMRVAADPDGRASAGPAIRIQGTKGEIQVDHPAYRPTTYRIVRHADVANEGKGRSLVEEHVVEMPGGGRGFMYEADESARCIRDKKLESEVLNWEESTIIMHVMDEVRRQNSMRYPDKLETLDYPIDHW